MSAGMANVFDLRRLGGVAITLGQKVAASSIPVVLASDQAAIPISLATANNWSYAAAAGGISNTTTAVTIKGAAGGGVKNYLSSMQVSSDALGAATELAIRDGAGGTVLWRMKIGTSGIVNGQITFERPLASTANTLLEIVTLTASITGGVFVNAQGYTGT